MPRLKKAASVLAVLALTAAPALADADHHTGNGAGPTGKDKASPQMNGDMHKNMMQMMMQMHAGGDLPMKGMGSFSMGMMDRDMMQMMLPMMGASGGGVGDMRDMMQQGLKSHDGDGDGSLSLKEFADWHAQMMRETMVDRFQHLDADGDGKITGPEMQGIAGRIGPKSGMMDPTQE
ncbi:EF-hand domain protein (plasmid) [Antarctobacter heliothermus]|uniref:EF-hand domain protein n=1 Tax=Antarctobacter heliothermus TaxID=74033 RepID=A0A222EB44_9RHOB|nr:calcium-binding protein [Antarctobacter heliothermus]ASP23415.1 EF-hand domain protein [Antarctobacter heliothermus]|tara:strand:- start:528 stop:1058 length:531 start_codon:yes stop_codon:yes gene_type:complete